MQGHEAQAGQEFVVMPAKPSAHTSAASWTVSIISFDEKTSIAQLKVGTHSYEINSDWKMGELRMQGLVNGHAFTAQVERDVRGAPLAIRVIHHGTQLDALVLTPQVAAMQSLMPHKTPPDLSKFLLSPMPGLLVNVAVELGQKVQAGERLAVIEAMKMENILFATQDGVVAKIAANKGESLSVDQVILEFA
jgi:propionyl-CoA carboxylase alpha chain